MSRCSLGASIPTRPAVRRRAVLLADRAGGRRGSRRVRLIPHVPRPLPTHPHPLTCGTPGPPHPPSTTCTRHTPYRPSTEWLLVLTLAPPPSPQILRARRHAHPPMCADTDAWTPLQKAPQRVRPFGPSAGAHGGSTNRELPRRTRAAARTRAAYTGTRSPHRTLAAFLLRPPLPPPTLCWPCLACCCWLAAAAASPHRRTR